MHQLQSDQLIITAVNAHDKVQAGIALVHHLQHIVWLPVADKLDTTAVNAHNKIQTGIGWFYTTCRMCQQQTRWTTADTALRVMTTI